MLYTVQLQIEDIPKAWRVGSRELFERILDVHGQHDEAGGMPSCEYDHGSGAVRVRAMLDSPSAVEAVAALDATLTDLGGEVTEASASKRRPFSPFG